MNWIPQTDLPRGSTVNFPIMHHGWFALPTQFMPARSSAVTLTLYYGRPVYLGEIGAFTGADACWRAHSYGDFR